MTFLIPVGSFENDGRSIRTLAFLIPVLIPVLCFFDKSKDAFDLVIKDTYFTAGSK